MSTGEIVSAVVVVILFAISSLMALAETAFTRASRIRLRALAEDGDKRANRLVELLDEPERTLNAVLLVVLVSQMTSATLTGSLLESAGGWIGFAIGTVFEVFVFFTFAEVAPKTYAVKHPEATALRLSGLLSFMTNFLPFRVFVRAFIGLANTILPGKGLAKGPYVTQAEILAMVDVAADEASIEHEERELVHAVLEIGDTPVSDVMVPRTQMRAVEVDATVDEAIDVLIESGYSRVPCYDESTDNIVGLVFLKDLVGAARQDAETTVRASLRDVVYVPESKKVDELLREMQAKKFHMAVVVDEYGGTAGLVTLEDLLEEIVGEIVDEFDVGDEQEIEQLEPGRWRVAGRLPIGDLEDEVNDELADDWDTVGGLVFNTMGHVPEPGECVDYKGYEFCAETMDGRRIVTVLVRRLPRADDERTGEHPAVAPMDGEINA